MKEGSSCPKKTFCNNYSGTSVSYGVINFDGKSTATFKSFSVINGSSNGSPKAGTKFKYVLSAGQISFIKPGGVPGPIFHGDY